VESNDPEDGSPRVDAKFVPQDYAAARQVLRVFQDRIFDQARRAGRHEPVAAYAADAAIAAILAGGTTVGVTPPAELTTLDPTTIDPDDTTGPGSIGVVPSAGLTTVDTSAVPPRATDDTDCSSDACDGNDPAGAGSAAGRQSRAKVGLGPPCVLVDAIALQRGYLAPGETCEIPGVGPVDLDWARQLMGDQLVDVIVHDGVDITTYASTTRYVPRPVRVAIHVRDRGCTRPTCDRDERLERDHEIDFADTHRTNYRDLHHLCRGDHDAKTYRGARHERHGDQWWWYEPPDPPGPDGTTPPPVEPQRGPVGRHLTPWNLDHLPGPPGHPSDTDPATDLPDQPVTPGLPDDDPPRLDLGG
jgi:hypothetical protein